MALLLLWLAGNALLLTILAVPPVIPLIHDQLMMSATQVGILTGLPSLLLAVAAVPGSLIVAKLGVRWALVVGLLATAIGGALRGLFPDIGWLYAMTIASAAGVAVMQVTMPSAAKAWSAARSSRPVGAAGAMKTPSNGTMSARPAPSSSAPAATKPKVMAPPRRP